MLRQTLFEWVTAAPSLHGSIDDRVTEVLERRRDPHSVVEEIIAANTPK